VPGFDVEPSEIEPVELLIVEDGVADAVPPALIEVLSNARGRLEIDEGLVPSESRLRAQARRIYLRESILQGRVLRRYAATDIWPDFLRAQAG
jgi:hypothetical protein